MDMKGAFAFIFFMLFLAGIAFVNLKGAQEQPDASAATPADISIPAWRPTHLGEMRLEDNNEMFVQFEDNGQLRGHGGCNLFSGNYDLEDGSLQVGPLRSTRMACPEPAMSFEMSFMEALQTPAKASIVGNKLVLRTTRDDIAIRFTAIDQVEGKEK
jgi:heat shock protein HslJ